MRIRKGILLLALLLLCCLTMAQAAEQELLENGSFEQLDADGMPTGWYTDAYVKREGMTLYSTSQEGRTGSVSARVENFGLNDARFAQRVAVEPNSCYRLSGYIRTQGISEEGCGANLSIEGVYVLSEGVFDTEGEWKYVELYGRTGPEQSSVTIYARVGGYGGESMGAAEFDDLSLVKLDIPAATSGYARWYSAQSNTETEQEPAEPAETTASPAWPLLLTLSVAYAALVALVCWWVRKHPARPEKTGARTKRGGMPAFVVVGLLCAAVVRLVVAWNVSGYQVDVNCFLSWGNTMLNEGPTRFYQSNWSDYTPGYLYVLGLNAWIIRLVGSGVPGYFIHKLFPMLCDLLGACLVWRVARERQVNRRDAGLLTLALAFNPAIILNSAAWCQIDSVLCLGLMLVAYFAIHRRWNLCLPIYMLCVLIKPQALMLGFLGLAALVMCYKLHKKERKSILVGLLVSLVVAAVVVVPFSIHQQSPMWLIDKYVETLGSYAYATVNTTNLYYFLGANWNPVGYDSSLYAAAFFLGCSLTWAVYSWRKRVKEPLYGLRAAMSVFGTLTILLGLLMILQASSKTDQTFSLFTRLRGQAFHFDITPNVAFFAAFFCFVGYAILNIIAQLRYSSVGQMLWKQGKEKDQHKRQGIPGLPWSLRSIKATFVLNIVSLVLAYILLLLTQVLSGNQQNVLTLFRSLGEQSALVKALLIVSIAVLALLYISFTLRCFMYAKLSAILRAERQKASNQKAPELQKPAPQQAQTWPIPFAMVESAIMGTFAALFFFMCFFEVSWTLLGATAMAMSFAVVLPMFIRSSRLETLPLCGGVLFLLLYVFGIKMHERYLFPALFLLGMACALHRDRRLLAVLTGISCVLFVNEGIVLDNSLRLGASLGHLNEDTEVLAKVLSLVDVALALYSVWLCRAICQGEAPVRCYKTHPCSALDRVAEPGLKWKRLDWLLMLSVTLVYAVVTLTTLGSTKAPQSSWTSTTYEEQAVIDLGQHYDDVRMLYFCQVSYSDFSVAMSEDGETWGEEHWAQMAEGMCYRWLYLTPSWEGSDGKRTYPSTNSLAGVEKLSGRYVRISAQQVGLYLNEVIFRDAEGNTIPAAVVEARNSNANSPLYSDPARLLDEQDTLEGEPGWWNSTYFDEIYHARTAYEHLHGEYPYENSHPPLGKVIMSWSIALFGMTPFGWRFGGALCGILMLPVMYLLGKQLTKNSWMAFTAMLLMALDCMHFTQTRIATIDSYPVLFILCSYLFMLRFMQRDIVREKMTRLLPDLALSGLFMGLGIASKWIGIYSAAGLAVLYFWTCARALRISGEAARLKRDGSAKGLTEEQRALLDARDEPALRRCIFLCLWCLLFFIVVPVVIYLLAYIPFFAYSHPENLRSYIELVIQAQEGMFKYHSKPGLGMDHPYYSPWYEWPFVIRPMYYASPQFVPEGWSYALFCFGNPAVWLVGLLGIGYTVVLWARRRIYRLEGKPQVLHLYADTWDVSPAFLIVGLLAQFLPWMLVPRGTYIYHYFASTPFLMLGTMLMLHHLVQRRPRAGKAVISVYLISCAVFFVAYFPYASGLTVPTGWLDFMGMFLALYH